LTINCFSFINLITANLFVEQYFVGKHVTLLQLPHTRPSAPPTTDGMPAQQNRVITNIMLAFYLHLSGHLYTNGLSVLHNDY